MEIIIWKNGCYASWGDPEDAHVSNNCDTKYNFSTADLQFA